MKVGGEGGDMSLLRWGKEEEERRKKSQRESVESNIYQSKQNLECGVSNFKILNSISPRHVLSGLYQILPVRKHGESSYDTHHIEVGFGFEKFTKPGAAAAHLNMAAASIAAVT